MIKLNKMIHVLIVFLFINIFMFNYSYALVAGEGSDDTAGGTSTGLGDLNSYAQEPGTTPTEFRQKANKVIGIIQVCGSIFSVIALIAIGIRYMFSSIEEKAEYKKTMMGYIIGCVMVFCLTNILAFVYDLANP